MHWFSTLTTQTSTKSGTNTPDAASNSHDLLFDEKKAVREKIIQRWNCTEHSLPDKPAACWHHRDHPGVCYPITLGNSTIGSLSLWVILHSHYSTFVLITSGVLSHSLEILKNTMRMRNRWRWISPLLTVHQHPGHHHHNSPCLCQYHIHSIPLPICIYLNPPGLQALCQYHQPHSLWGLARTPLSHQNMSQVQLSQPGFNT